MYLWIFIVTLAASAFRIQIDPSIKFQTIDGFGGSNAFNSASGPITDDHIKLLFDPVDGIGLTLLRTQIPNNGECFSVNEDCVGINTIIDIKNVKKYPVKIWATPWSPPRSFKNRGYLMKKNYEKYANYLKNYCQSVNLTTGTQLYAISIQNEPNARVKWDTAKWTQNQFYDFLKILKPILGDSIKTIMPETASWGGLVDFNKARLIQNADIIAFHNYDAKGPKKIGYQFGQKTLWQTEVCGLVAFKTNEWDPSISDAIKWSISIHNWVVNGNLNAWHWWWLTGRPDAKKESNQELINSSGQIAKRLYAIGHFSKFVRPGFIRIKADINIKGVFVSAYTNRLKIVLIVINSLEVNVKIDPFIDYIPNTWITSNNFNLKKVDFDGTLPSQSITTFEF